MFAARGTVLPTPWTELNALIGNLSKEGATARTKLESSVTESQKKSKKEVDDALAAASKKADENIRKALAEVASSAKKSTEELNKFKVATESTVAGKCRVVVVVVGVLCDSRGRTPRNH